MLIDAVIEGQGVALARTTLAATDLLTGRLVRPFPVALPLSNTFWIICPKATKHLPKLIAFREWLLAEAAADTQLLEGRLVTSDSVEALSETTRRAVRNSRASLGKDALRPDNSPSNECKTTG